MVKYKISVSEEEYNAWVENMQSNKTFTKLGWLNVMGLPCGIASHSWSNGVATIVAYDRSCEFDILRGLY